MVTATAPLIDEPPAKMGEIAAALNVSLSTVKAMSAAGEIPGRLSVSKRLVRFRRDVVRDWIAGLTGSDK